MSCRAGGAFLKFEIIDGYIAVDGGVK